MTSFIFKFKHFLSLNTIDDYMIMQKKGYYQEVIEYLKKEKSKGISSITTTTSISNQFLKEDFINSNFIKLFDNAFKLEQKIFINEILKDKTFSDNIMQ